VFILLAVLALGCTGNATKVIDQGDLVISQVASQGEKTQEELVDKLIIKLQSVSVFGFSVLNKSMIYIDINGKRVYIGSDGNISVGLLPDFDINQSQRDAIIKLYNKLGSHLYYGYEEKETLEMMEALKQVVK
jgi:hypothetical protein